MSDLDRQIEMKVAAEVEKQLSRERVILKEAGSIAVKIIAGSFILLFAIFTVFGLTTWQDVKKETSEFVKNKAEELIQKNDSETGVKQTLNNLVNRAIVASELLALKRQSKAPFELPQNEWDRLRNWLKGDTLGVQEFTDTLTILNAQRNDRKKADANTFLSEMLNPPDGSPYQWIRKQPDKRMAIMSTFEQLDMGGSAVEIAQSSNVSEETRIAATKYLRSIRYVEGFDKILRLASSTDESDLKREALITSAVLRPTDTRLLKEIEKLTGQMSPRSGAVRTAVEIVREVWSSRYDQEGRAERLDATKKLLEFAFKYGTYLSEESDPRMRFLTSAIIVGTAGGERTTLSGAVVGKVRLIPRSRNDGPIEVNWIDSEKRALRENLLEFSGVGFKFSCSPLSPAAME